MESRESAAARYRSKIQHARQVERGERRPGAERQELAAFRAEQG